jgi:hypothetical protein
MEQPDGMHIMEIANKTGVDEDKLGRILRLLASTHVFREGNFALLEGHCPNAFSVKRNVFANNRLSLQLLATNPLSSLGLFVSVPMYPSLLRAHFRHTSVPKKLSSPPSRYQTFFSIQTGAIPDPLGIPRSTGHTASLKHSLNGTKEYVSVFPPLWYTKSFSPEHAEYG